MQLCTRHHVFQAEEDARIDCTVVFTADHQCWNLNDLVGLWSPAANRTEYHSRPPLVDELDECSLSLRQLSVVGLTAISQQEPLLRQPPAIVWVCDAMQIGELESETYGFLNAFTMEHDKVV